MEIYTNAAAADRAVFLEFPDPVQTIDAFVWRDDEMLMEINSVLPVPGEGFLATLPLHLLQHSQHLEVRWTATYVESSDDEVHTVNRTSPVEVVNPILTPREIRRIDPVVFDTMDEIHRIEKAVRHIIQAYTGQEFTNFYGTLKVRGDDSAALFLPRRIIELETVNGLAAAQNYLIDPDGYIIRYFPYGVPPVKADYFGLHQHVGGVIHNPNNVSIQRFKERTYSIKGRWGWEEVPASVKEAAKLLVNDYACADANYRDRYLTSMTAADWRIQFHSGAFVRTGNVRADQLLSDFVVTRGWGVI